MFLTWNKVAPHQDALGCRVPNFSKSTVLASFPLSCCSPCAVATQEYHTGDSLPEGQVLPG